MKSGPRELKAYHELVLRAERNKVTVEQQEMLERGNARLMQMANGLTNGAEKPQRRPRSDKGTHRPARAPETPAGCLSEQQWARINVLGEQVWQSATALLDASQRHERAKGEYRDYLDSLKAR